MPSIAKIALGTVAVAGVGIAAEHWIREVRTSQGGTPNGSLWSKFQGYRHVIGFGLRNAWRPGALRTAHAAEADARAAEYALYHDGRHKNGYDNGADAFRHAYASALITYRLMADEGMSAESAMKFAWDAGMAHELDSKLTGVHRGYSSVMDVHNNSVGIHIGAEQALAGLQREDADQALQGAIIAALERGDLVVLDTTTTPPRPSRPEDIQAPIVDTPAGEEPAGSDSFTHGFEPHDPDPVPVGG